MPIKRYDPDLSECPVGVLVTYANHQAAITLLSTQLKEELKNLEWSGLGNGARANMMRDALKKVGAE